jgi:hypothetical protein
VFLSGTSLRPDDFEAPSGNPTVGTRKIPDYRSYAQECRRLAAQASTDEQRQLLLEMASTWLSLAEHYGAPDSGKS